MNEQGDAGTSNAGNTEDIAEFQRRMETLSKLERNRAQAFLECRIHDQFLWPLENESKQSTDSRKKLNLKILVAARKKLRRSNETQEQTFTRLKDVRENTNRRRSEETEESRNSRMEANRQRSQESYNYYNYEKQFSCEVCGKSLNGRLDMRLHKKNELDLRYKLYSEPPNF